MAVLSKPIAVLSRPASPNSRFINNGRFIKAEGQANGRLFTRSRRVADGRFHIVPYKQFISGQAELFLAKPRQPVDHLSPVDHFIAPDGRLSRPMAVLSNEGSP